MSTREISEIQWLHSMRALYVLTADDKLSQLGQALHGLEESPKSPVAYRRLDRLLHNLIGSGGSYGLPEVSDAARKMLQRLKQAHSDGLDVCASLTSEMEAGINDLREIFAEASASDSVGDISS